VQCGRIFYLFQPKGVNAMSVTKKEKRRSRRAAVQQTFADRALFTMPGEKWEAFCAALDAPPKPVPALRRLLTRPSVFDAKRDD
jgi:hypothetical protein